MKFGLAHQKISDPKGYSDENLDRFITNEVEKTLTIVGVIPCD